MKNLTSTPPAHFAVEHDNRWEAASFNWDYVRRLQEGDWETQRHFTWYFGRLLNSKVRSRVRSPHLREEVRQETFLRVLLIVGPTILSTGSGTPADIAHVRLSALKTSWRTWLQIELTKPPRRSGWCTPSRRRSRRSYCANENRRCGASSSGFPPRIGSCWNRSFLKSGTKTRFAGLFRSIVSTFECCCIVRRNGFAYVLRIARFQMVLMPERHRGAGRPRSIMEGVPLPQAHDRRQWPR